MAEKIMFALCMGWAAFVMLNVILSAFFGG
jgi:hypothetical protein